MGTNVSLRSRITIKTENVLPLDNYVRKIYRSASTPVSGNAFARIKQW